MNEQNIKRAIPAETSFFELSEKFGDISPFRRILSLLRIEKKCMTIVEVTTVLKNKNDFKCHCIIDDSRRCKSCQNYIKQVNQDGNLYKILEKKCTKMFFFSSVIKDPSIITDDDIENEFLGYCVIHSDTLSDKKGKSYKREYVPESILTRLEENITGINYGNYNSYVYLENKKIKINKGVYFSQQNGMTNCCAHAAIKTAIRAYDDNVSCDEINKILIKSYGEKSEGAVQEILRLSKGLTPDEMLCAIEEYSNSSKDLPDISPFLVTAHDLPIASFIETIYRAIESKIPVILLLRIPDNLIAANSFGGHAVSLTGHTFNSHNWCAYGSGYFSVYNTERFLSSYIWCDNYIVQDDNFGPSYQLPCNFLADYYDYGVSIEKLGLNIASQKRLNKFHSNYPLAAIVMPPKIIKKITRKLYFVENIAARYFVEQIDFFAKNKELAKIELDEHKILFNRFFYYIFKYNRKSKVFITRSVLTSRKEYLNSSVKSLYDQEEVNKSQLTNLVFDTIPEYFWLTEISVPELYWINKAKVGEIIVDFERLGDKNGGISLIRLPYFLALYPKDEKEYFSFYLKNQLNAYYEILKKSEGIIRHLKNGE
ncbi:MAG: hypothetical protein EOM37_11880 [Proteobacteria bacterium]|nr:hypothetical protein [Pseudomonadota bacterium]